MKIKSYLLTVFALALFFTRCETNDIFYPESADSAALKSAKKVERDLKIFNATGKVYFDETTGNVIACGNGIASHLGNFSFQERYAFDEFGIPSIFVEGYYAAANGDKVNYIITEHWIDENSVNHSRHIITGGTGRFENAEGTFVTNVIMDYANSTFTAGGNGTILY